MPGHYVRSAILVGSIPLMAEWGRDALALSQELEIDPIALRDPDIPVPAARVLNFYERAAEITGCRSFGLRMAARTGLAVVGPLWILLRQAQTLEQMLDDLVAHFDLYTQAAVTSFRREGSGRRLCWATATGVSEREVQMAEFSVAVLCAEIRRYAPAGWEPASVSFRHAAPPDRSELRRVFGSNLSFDQPDNSILVERALLDRPLRVEGSRTRELLSHMLRQSGEPVDPGLVERVDGMVRALMPYASCSLADLGRALGMAPRSLQEHLQAQGSNFQQIRDRARADLAVKYLRHSRMSLTQIAGMLGYSELSAFSRSFRRWHGVPPRSLRSSRLPSRPPCAVAESAPANSARLPTLQTMNSSIPVITVDGPSGVGKGMVTRGLALRLPGWHRLDSGALYRILALAATRGGLDLAEVDAVAALATKLDISFDGDTEDDEAIIVNGVNLVAEIRSESTGGLASRIATAPVVRDALLQRQRDFRQSPGLIADGRDMGTVVFPDAGLKIFLTASPEERARRRAAQLSARGQVVTLADLSAEIRARDERDRTRAVAPLVPAPDAYLIDTSLLNPAQVFERIDELLKTRGFLR